MTIGCLDACLGAGYDARYVDMMLGVGDVPQVLGGETPFSKTLRGVVQRFFRGFFQTAETSLN
jgi:hypothetical protein